MTKFKDSEMQIARYFITSQDLDQVNHQAFACHTSVAKLGS